MYRYPRRICCDVLLFRTILTLWWVVARVNLSKTKIFLDAYLVRRASVLGPREWSMPYSEYAVCSMHDGGDFVRIAAAAHT